MSSCNEHLRAGSRCWMIIAILRPVDHKREETWTIMIKAGS